MKPIFFYVAQYIILSLTIEALCTPPILAHTDRVRITFLNRDTHDAYLVIQQQDSLLRERLGKFGGRLTIDVSSTAHITVEGGGTGSLGMQATQFASCNEINSIQNPAAPGRLVLSVTPLHSPACS